MKRKIIYVLIASMVLLSGCGKGEPQKVKTCADNGEHAPFTEEDLEELNKERAKQGLPASVKPTSAPIENADVCAMYIPYLFKALDKNPYKNVVISPESLNIALDYYADILAEEDKTALREFLGKDYKAITSNDSMKIANRIWVNANKNVNVDKIESQDIVSELDMSDEAEATRKKNNYVAEQTDNFILGTYTSLNDNVVMDVMNVLYFKDNWLGGKKDDTRRIDFKNFDSTNTKKCLGITFEDNVTAFRDANRWGITNYTIPYEHGYELNIITCEDGDYRTRNYSDLLKRDLYYFEEYLPMDEKTGELLPIHLTIPQFAIDTSIDSVLPSNLTGLDIGKINQDIYDGDIAATISQVNKIIVDNSGTTAAAVTEVMTRNIAVESKNYVDVVIDRPFMFYITDTVNNEVAFIGFVNNLEGQ